MSTDLVIAGASALPAIDVLAEWFDDVGGAEGGWTRGVTIGGVRVAKGTAAEWPGVRELPAAQRKTVVVVMGKGTFALDVAERIAEAIGGALYREDGVLLAKAKRAKPPKPKPAKKSAPKLDVSIPADIADALLGKHLPVLVTRDVPDTNLSKLASLLPADVRKRAKFSGVASWDGAYGDLHVNHIYASDCAKFAGELAQVGVKKPAMMLRALPAVWFREPVVTDERPVLGIFCALARLGRGVIYARPGGRKLQATDAKAVLVSFDFATRQAQE